MSILFLIDAITKKFPKLKLFFYEKYSRMNIVVNDFFFTEKKGKWDPRLL